MKPIKRQYLRFGIALLDYQVYSGHYYNAIISALAVLRIDIDESIWLPAEGYTPKLSAVIKLARIIVILEVYDSVRDPEYTAVIDKVSRKIERFIIINRPTLIK